MAKRKDDSPYRIVIEKAADRVIEKTPLPVRNALADAIEALAKDPRPDGVKKLKGEFAQY